jgi:uncharacterized repeat protein (TIGR03803 family)
MPAQTVTTLASFNFTNGAYPMAGLALGSNGVFYGTTCAGGTNNLGTIFSLLPGGPLTTLVSFNGTNNGAFPDGGLVLGTNGFFYGTTFRGGTNDSGNVFKMTSDGTLTTLVSLTSADANGYNPPDGLVLGVDGNFYGVNYSGGANGFGAIFKLTHDGILSIIAPLTAASVARLVQGTNGNFYDTTATTIFNATTGGTLNTLFTFSGNGANPTAGLVQGADGNFYGTTEYGGVGGCGTMFEISPSGAFSNLFSFGINGANNGSSPDAEMVQSAGSGFYGTTSSGGSFGGGNIVQIGRTAPFFLPAAKAAGALTLTWTAVAGLTNQVQYITNLSQTVWNNLGGAVTATNTTMTITDFAPQDPQRFYRVILQ